MERTELAGIAGEVRANLARQNQTKAWLANATGIRLHTLLRRLNGASDFTLDELVKVAAALNVRVADLAPEVAA